MPRRPCGRFPLTTLCYALITMHAVILMVGGHHTYALVPFGDWLRELLDLSRNRYDRIGHFAQGFAPAFVARELLLRHTPLQRGGWLFTIVAGMCLAVSACYESIEWFAALIGAITAQLLLSRLHDRQLARLLGRGSRTDQTIASTKSRVSRHAARRSASTARPSSVMR